MNKLREKDFVNYIVTGSRYQVHNEKGEPTPEFGQGIFRDGIRLKLASKLYEMLVGNTVRGPWNEKTQRAAREAASAAFNLTEVFLEEMDERFRRPLPENDGAKRG